MVLYQTAFRIARVAKGSPQRLCAESILDETSTATFKNC